MARGRRVRAEGRKLMSLIVTDDEEKEDDLVRGNRREVFVRETNN